jgi:hypothetical protein
MLEEDFVIQSQVRRILVRSNVDYSKMNFGTVKGVVYLRGLFQLSRIYTQGDEEKDDASKIRDFTIKILASLEMKIRSVPGVSDMIFQLLNWKKERGKWIPIGDKKKQGEGDEKEKGHSGSEGSKGG